MAYLVLNCEITQFNLKGVHRRIKNKSFIIVLHTAFLRKKYVFAATLVYVHVCTFVKFTKVY